MSSCISLNGSDWLFKDFYGEDWRWRGSHLPDSRNRCHRQVGSVPGCPRHDLCKSAAIPDAYIDRNSLLSEPGFYTIKHKDGNTMPILVQLVAANPHALHSLDPQGGVDIAEVKRRYSDQLCLIRNVKGSALDSSSEADVRESARYALQHGMPGGGSIFSTSNCVYIGMLLSNYELMLDICREEGNYQ